MSESQNVFPLDITEREPGARPWKFRPDGYLVVVVSDEVEAQRAQEALIGVGFAARDIELYPGTQILATFEVYKGQRNTADRVAGVIRDDIRQRSLPRLCREGRCGLWLRVHEDKVPKALRVLADHDYLHTRYYGVNSETDYNLSGPRT